MKQLVNPEFPSVIRIEPAGACNLKCSHCPTGTIKMRRGVMTRRTFRLCLRQLKACKNIRVVVLYHGGEPLLNRDFISMVKLVKSLGVPFVKTVTNGMLLTDNLMRGLITSGLDAIEFSLDGQGPEENDTIRGNCNFYRVAGNIRRLIELKKQMHSLAPQIWITSAQFMGRPHSGVYKNNPLPEIPGYLLAEFLEEHRAKQVNFKPVHAFLWPFMKIDKKNYTLRRQAGRLKNYCDYAQNTLTIRWDGSVVACCYDLTSGYTLGNIHNQSLEDIWHGARYIRLRKSIAEGRPLPLCRNCAVLGRGKFLVRKA